MEDTYYYIINPVTGRKFESDYRREHLERIRDEMNAHNARYGHTLLYRIISGPYEDIKPMTLEELERTNGRL